MRGQVLWKGGQQAAENWPRATTCGHNCKYLGTREYEAEIQGANCGLHSRLSRNLSRCV